MSRAVVCVGIWVDEVARLNTLTQNQEPSPILLKVWRNFKEGQHFGQQSNISQVCIFLKHWCSQVSLSLRMLFECMLLVFDFIANWYLKKQRNLHKFFQKRISDIFKWTFWQTSFHQVLYSNKEILYPRSFMSSKASLLTSIPKNVSPWLWL